MKSKKLSKIITAALIASTMMLNSISVFATGGAKNEKVNIALGKTVEASSIEASKWGPDKVTDGVTDRGADPTKPGGSRWSSNALNNGQNPQWLVLDLGEVKSFDEVVIEWERNNITSYKVEISDDKTNWTSVHEATNISALRDVIELDKDYSARYIRVYVANNDPNAVVKWDNVSVYEVEVYDNEGEIVPPPFEDDTPTQVNLAYNKTAVSSANETAALSADKVVDGDTESRSSRWSSGSFSGGNKQWIYVDLGKEMNFDHVKLYWEGANAKVYEIQTSNDGENWTTVNRKTNAPGGVETVKLAEKERARYVRVFCEENNPAVWTSVSLYEVEIYNGLPASIDDVVTTIQPKISEDGTRLEMPNVPAGYEVSFIGADYSQIIDKDMNIHTPIVDTKVIVDFEVTKDGKKKTTSGLELVVPGTYNDQIGTNAKPQVIPELREWAPGNGDFTITDTTKVVVSTEDAEALKDTAEIFRENYRDIMGKDIEVVISDEPAAGDIFLSLGSTYAATGEEGYYINIGDKVEVEGNHPTGVLHATTSILQILKQTENTLPQGLVRDYPRYEVRGFMLDVGRKPITMDFLEEITKTMAWYKMNDFQVHLNDNYIWVNEYGDEAIEKAYAGFRLESDDVGSNGKKLTSEDLFYTKEEFSNYIDESKKYGVTIVPELESPAHALSFTKVHPEYAYGDGSGEHAAMLDVNNPEVVDYVKGIFSEYVDGGEDSVFRDAPVHIGSDEFYGTSEEYRKYTDDILKFMRDEKGRTTRVWGSLSQKKGQTPVTAENIQMNIWNTGWADPSDMLAQGYDLINTDDAKLYIVPSAGYYYDYLNAQNLYESWEVNKFSNGDVIPAGSDQMIGGMFAVWNDMIDRKANGIVEYDIYDRVLPAIQALSEKMWGRAEDKTYAEFKSLAKTIDIAPNSNPRSEVESKSEVVMDYGFNEDLTSLKDASGNDYNVVKTENVESVKGADGKAVKLNGGASYVQSPVDNLGPNYTVNMKVKRAANSGNEEQVLFESEKGAFKAVQKETGKVGFSREFYDFSFDYELPVGEWVELTVIGTLNKTILYVNGEYVDEISKAGTDGKYHGTFVFPLETIGSKTNSFKGEIDDLEVKNVKTSIEDKTIIPQENMTATATSEQSGSGEGPANLAIDGNEGSIWHTKWSPNKDELPQSITLSLGKEYTINKFSYLPRQNGSNGNITSYDLLVSTDGVNFTKVQEGTWANNNALKKAEFEPVKATHIKLTAKAGVGGFASAAELNVHQVIEDEVVETGKATITAADQVSVNDTFNVALGLNEITEGKEYYSAEYTFNYNPEVFEFKGATAVNETLFVNSSVVTPGQVRIVVASLGTPIVNGTDLVNVSLKALAKADAEALNTTLQVGDGDGKVVELEAGSKNVTVKENAPEEIIVSKVRDLKASEVTNSSVKLTWNAPVSTNGLTEYVIYKDGKIHATIPADNAELVVDSLRSNSIYGFKVVAKYSNGQESKPVSLNVRTTK